MADLTRVNPQIMDVINTGQQATMSPAVVKTSGAGKAYQSVSQSAAIAIQDATDNLRNVSTISTTAMGVAIAQLLAGNDSTALLTIVTAQGMLTSAAKDFESIGDAAAKIVRSFPSG